MTTMRKRLSEPQDEDHAQRTRNIHTYFEEKRRQAQEQQQKKVRCTAAASTVTAVAGTAATFTLASVLENTMYSTVHTPVANPISIAGIEFHNMTANFIPGMPPVEVSELAMELVKVNTTGAPEAIAHTFGWVPSAGFSIISATGGCFTVLATAVTGLLTWMCCYKQPELLDTLEEFARELSTSDQPESSASHLPLQSNQQSESSEAYQQLEEGDFRRRPTQ